MRNATLASSLLLSLALVPVTSQACLNDRDSDALAFEAKRLPIARPTASQEAPDIPGIIEVIVGRFPRNPALYYQLRMERCRKELAANPTRLPLYDDLSVAYDRLGKSAEALAWMEKKRAYIPAHDTEALYRYFANIGTFRAHHWLREGAKNERIAELKQARNEIAKALMLKPDAHFGRETVQLQAMDWILNERSKQSLASFVHSKATSENLVQLPQSPRTLDKTLLGLAGLVVLGNAWESVDVFGALAGQLNRRGDAKVAYLARLRCRELLRTGKKSLYTDTKLSGDSDSRREEDSLIAPRSRHWLGITNQDNVTAKFNELRADAEAWQTARTAFMETRLRTGRHPDTDPHFWDGYEDSPAPALDIPWHKEAGANFGNWLARYGAIGLFFLFWGCILGMVIYLIRPAKRRRS